MRQYEEAFIKATQRKRQPGEATRTQLKQTWQTLGLSEIDVREIEAPILAQVETHQVNLRQYEQEFVNATRQQYPLDDAKLNELQQRKRTLNLSDEDTSLIEAQIIDSIEEHLEKLQQYEQVFSDSIQFEYPISDETREELCHFQKVLELRDEEVVQLEEKVISQSNLSEPESQQTESPQALENEPPQVQPQYRVEDPTQLQEVAPLTPTTSPPSNVYHQALPLTQKITPESTNSLLQNTNRGLEQCLAVLVIIVGSFWALLCISALSIPHLGSGGVFFVLLLAGLGFLGVWAGVRLLRRTSSQP